MNESKSLSMLKGNRNFQVKLPLLDCISLDNINNFHLEKLMIQLIFLLVINTAKNYIRNLTHLFIRSSHRVVEVDF